MRTITSLTLLALLALLAACGTAAPASAPTSPAAQEQPSQAPPSGATTAAQPDDQGALITLQKSGGIAGTTQTLTVHADGSAAISGAGVAKSGQVAQANLDRLRALIDSPEVAALNARYSAPGADQITYRLTISQGGGQRTIVTMDGASHPPALDQLLAELSQVQAQVK